MLCLNFCSADLPYRTMAEVAGTSHLLPSALYNADLLGEDGFECLDHIDGLYHSAADGELVDSGTLVITGWTRQRWWPSWARWRWTFDAESGLFLGRDAAPGGYYAQDVRQGCGGELWLQLITGPLQCLGPDAQPTGETLRPETFGVISFGAFLIDLAQDWLIATVNSNRALQVYRLSSGAWSHTITLPFRPVDLCYEGGSRAYVLTESRQLFLLDYANGRIYGAFKLGPGPALWLGSTRIAWDPRYRRLLLVEPPAARGFAYTTRIQGYALRPVATHLCAPLPLRRLRAGQPTPVLVKAIGDRGEGLSGMVQLQASSQLALSQQTLSLDGRGEAIVHITGLAEGHETIHLTLEIPCLS